MPTYQSPGVYVEEVEAGSRPIEGVGTAVAAFVGMASAGPFHQPTLVTNWTQFTDTFGDFVEGSHLAHAVYGYFNNGGGSAYIVRVGGDSDGQGSLPVASAELTSATQKGQVAYRVKALAEGAPGDELTVEITGPGEAAEGDGEDLFALVVKRGNKVEEAFDNLSARRGKQHVATIVNEQSKLVRIEEIASLQVADRRPESGAVKLHGGTTAPAPVRIGPDDYVGDSADRTGFGGLEAIDDITMVVVPDLMAAYQQGVIDGDGVRAVQLAMIAHCEQMGDRLALLDAPPGLTAQQVKEWRTVTAGYDSKQAALYWPWIRVFDPARRADSSQDQHRLVPPSGHVAGVWARSDSGRGVHKAPANEVVRGVLGLETTLTRAEQDLLNPSGVNCIRSFAGRGIRVWGARTLSSDPAWRYVNVRRLFNYLEGSILQGTQWAVFEPNDLDLWQRLRRTITEFLTTQWRSGALVGASPSQAFYVKCDAETNPPDLVNRGQVTVEVGVCPVKPAEFVVFRLAQMSDGADITE